MMKHIELGTAPAQLTGSVLTYENGNYRHRVKIPTGLPLAHVTVTSKGRSTITFSSWKGAVCAIAGHTETIEAIANLVGIRAAVIR